MKEISRLTLPKELTQTIDEVKNLTIEDGIEYGFTIFYRDGIMFPGHICIGDECGVQMQIRLPFFTNVFGSFHTHPIRKKIKDCSDRKEITEEQITLAIHRNQSIPSLNDLLTSIEDLYLRGNVTDSAVLIMSDVDINNSVSVYIPKRLVPTKNFKDALDKLQKIPEPEYKKICDIIISPNEEELYKYVFDLFYQLKFSVPSNKDIIIERNNETYEYKLFN